MASIKISGLTEQTTASDTDLLPVASSAGTAKRMTLANFVTWLASKLNSKMIEDSNYPGCYYRVVNGEKEWLNPPMVLGVEYRTTERQQGKPVYTKLIDLGTLPTSGLKEVATGLDVSAITVTKDRYMIHTNDGFHAHLPYMEPNGIVSVRAHVSNSTKIDVYTLSDLGFPITGEAQLKYVYK